MWHWVRWSYFHSGVRRDPRWDQEGLTFGVQQTRQPQVLLGCAESSLQVVVGVGLGEFAEIHQIRPGQGHRAGRQQAGSKWAGRWRDTLA